MAKKSKSTESIEVKKTKKTTKSKLKTNVFVICDYASMDREGKLSLNGIFAEMYVDKMPAYFLRFYIAATILGTPEKTYDVQITVYSPDNKVVNHEETTIQLGTGGVSHLITDIHNFPVEQIGEYTIKLKTNNKNTIGETSFKVIDLNTKRESVN